MAPCLLCALLLTCGIPRSLPSLCFIASDYFDIIFSPLCLLISGTVYRSFLCLGIDNLERILVGHGGTHSNSSTQQIETGRVQSQPGMCSEFKHSHDYIVTSVPKSKKRRCFSSLYQVMLSCLKMLYILALISTSVTVIS